MMLGAAKGDTIEIAAEGEDAEARLGELVTLVESGFGED
jgi:phosphocarrier protein